MKKKLQGLGFIRNLRNDELVSFMKEVVKTVEETPHSIENASFAMLLESLTAQMGLLDLMRKDLETIEQTKSASRLNDLRINGLRSIRHLINSGPYRIDEDEKISGFIISNWFNGRFDSDLAVSQDTITNLIAGVLLDLDQNQPVVEALDSLGWMKPFSDLAKVNNEYLDMRVTRNVDSSSSDMARLNATKCRKDATETLKALVKTVEIEYTIHGLKVCGQLILSLGKIFDRSRSIVNARATRRRKAKELAAKIAPVASRIDMTDDMPFVVGKFSKLEDRPENLDLITEAS